MVRSQELRPGMGVELDGQVWVVVNTEHVKPGKGPAYTQAKLKNIKTGQNLERRLRSGEEIPLAVLDRREMEYLYSDGTGAVFMDSEDYEQQTLSTEVLGDALMYLIPNTHITALVYEGQVVTIDLPAAVELKIVETAPQPKGATATNQLKEAELETGLKTRVPPFIENGEVVKVSTTTAEYLGRA